MILGFILFNFGIISMAAPPARARADYDYLIKLLLIGDSGNIFLFFCFHRFVLISLFCRCTRFPCFCFRYFLFPGNSRLYFGFVSMSVVFKDRIFDDNSS